MQIRDRAKDLIKTGGEWISSIDLEGVAMAHPAVAMAAVVGVRHPKWEERPLLFIVRKPDSSLEGDEILVFLAERVAKWWIPDAVIFLDALPVGGTGKVQKAALARTIRKPFLLAFCDRAALQAGLRLRRMNRKIRNPKTTKTSSAATAAAMSIRSGFSITKDPVSV